MRQLHFFSPNVDAFIGYLRSLWDDGIRSIHLMGKHDWADTLATAAKDQGIALLRNDLHSVSDSPGTRAIVFSETDGERLGEQLMACVGLSDVVVAAPVTDWHFTKKPLFLVSIPKAGTHLLYELAQALGYHAGIECPEFPRGQTWYCVEYSNSHTVAKDFFIDTVRRAPFGNRHHSFMRSPALFMYRHPLDILVSEAHYYHRDGKAAFAGWLSQYDFEERVKRLSDDNWLTGSLRERVGGFLPWMEFPNVIPLSFEQLVGAAGGGSDADQRDLIWSIQLKVQAPGDTDAIASRLFNPRSATFRTGQIGAYRSQLPQEAIFSWSDKNADILTRLGYPLDGAFGMPKQRQEHRCRPIRYSKFNYDEMPLTVESDFLGCNLVRYKDRIYAIPMAAGAVSLENLPAATLADMPYAESLSEIKSLLLVGHPTLMHRKQALDRLAEQIQGKEATGTIPRYWKEDGEPKIIESYNGFNLVAYRGLYAGLRQSVGVVNLSCDLRELVQQFTVGDVVVCASLAEVRIEIEGLATAQRAWKDASVAHDRALALIGALEGRLASLDKRVQVSTAALEARQAAFGLRLEAERQPVTEKLDVLERGAVVTSEHMTTLIEKLEARQAALEQRCAGQDARILELESNWLTRLASTITRMMRGTP